MFGLRHFAHICCHLFPPPGELLVLLTDWKMKLQADIWVSNLQRKAEKARSRWDSAPWNYWKVPWRIITSVALDCSGVLCIFNPFPVCCGRISALSAYFMKRTKKVGC